MRHARHRTTALATLALLAVTACAPHQTATIAMRATALDLQFARPDLAKPIPPNVIVQILPAPAAPTPVTVSRPVVTSPPPSVSVPEIPAPACPTAQPAVPLQQSTLGSPAPGFYHYDTKGSATVSGGAQTVTATIPPDTQTAISRAARITPDSTIGEEGGAPPSGKEASYTVTTHLSNNVSQIDQLTVSAGAITLAQRTLSDGQRTLTFTPTPQVELVVFGPVGSTWGSTGTDSSSGSVMNLQGKIASTTVVKVCGQPVNAYVVSYSSTLTNPAVGEIIRTNSNDDNTMAIAPQLGGLVVAQHIDTDDIRLDANLGGYIGVTMAYDSTLHRLTPAAS